MRLFWYKARVKKKKKKKRTITTMVLFHLSVRGAHPAVRTHMMRHPPPLPYVRIIHIGRPDFKLCLDQLWNVLTNLVN